MNVLDNEVSYCTNIHPYHTVDQLIDVLNNEVASVASEFDSPFAVGLFLSHQMVEKLTNSETAFSRLQQTLVKHNFYVISLNCFPYGEFHGKTVKKQVYLPDWGDKHRLDYTRKAVDILAKLLPDGKAGSISTVPIAFGKKLPEQVFDNLAVLGEYLSSLTKNISIAFEPEPLCYLDSSQDCIDFFAMLYERLDRKYHHYFGVCFDSCHFAVMFEDVIQAYQRLENAQIPMSKIQISTAVKSNSLTSLQNFVEPIYLHQTTVKIDGILHHFDDLPKALKKNGEQIIEEARVHFHVPIYLDKVSDTIETTSKSLEKFINLIKNRKNLYLEVETYSLKQITELSLNVIDSTRKELRMLIKRLR